MLGIRIPGFLFFHSEKFEMHNKPHTEQAKKKMRLAHLGKHIKWDELPESDIVNRLLNTEATTRSIANEYGCSDSIIKLIFRKYTNKEQRLETKIRKQKSSLSGRKNPQLGEWRKTHDVWTGRKHSIETKNKQSLAKKDKKHTMAQNIAQSARLQGIDIEEWNGFATVEMQRKKSSREYTEWRKAVFERDNYTCQKCGTRAGRGKNIVLHPHHLKSKSKYPELMFNINNGLTLCKSCHKTTDSYGKM